jgi:hypothetical protein
MKISKNPILCYHSSPQFFFENSSILFHFLCFYFIPPDLAIPPSVILSNKTVVTIQKGSPCATNIGQCQGLIFFESFERNINPFFLKFLVLNNDFDSQVQS